MKKRLHTTVSSGLRVLILGACGIFSVFLAMSGYESVFSKSLPIVHTIDPVNLTAFSSRYKLTTSSFDNKQLYGSFGKPQTLKLQDRNARFTLAAPLEERGVWLSRANILHVFITEKPRKDSIGVAIMYCKSSFRTLNAQNLPKIGSNMFMDTDKQWRYIYRVSSTSILSDNVPYIAGDTGETSELIISCNDKKHHQNVVIEANLLSVQGVDQ